MNAFDVNILEFFNRFAHHAHILDESVVTLDTPVLKGGVVVAFVWWAWFADEGPDASRRRRILLSTLAASIMSVAVARGLAHVLPFRVRPLYEPELHFVPPFGASDIDLESWSSFPSDHAVLFFTLATGLYAAHRRLGIAAFVYAAVAICLPRVYLGIHWPTDILAGAAIGIGVGWIGTRDRVQRSIGTPLLSLQARMPGPFYASLFLIAFEIASLGADVRNIGSRLGDLL